jgi:hypothetical protein
MNRRFFVGAGLAGAAGFLSGGIHYLSATKNTLVMCISGVRKSDALQSGWIVSAPGSEPDNTAKKNSSSEKILPLRKTEFFNFSKENNHLDKLSGMLRHLGFREPEKSSSMLREQCFHEPLILKEGSVTLFYFDGLEVGHYSTEAYFDALKKAEKWVHEKLKEHFDRYGKNASYVICSEMGRDENPGNDFGGFHHNSEEAAFGFFSSCQA